MGRLRCVISSVVCFFCFVYVVHLCCGPKSATVGGGDLCVWKLERAAACVLCANCERARVSMNCECVVSAKCALAVANRRRRRRSSGTAFLRIWVESGPHNDRTDRQREKKRGVSGEGA